MKKLKIKCPKCGNPMRKPFVALSRDDNKTEVCPDCGTKEALEVFIKYLKEVKKE